MHKETTHAYDDLGSHLHVFFVIELDFYLFNKYKFWSKNWHTLNGDIQASEFTRWGKRAFKLGRDSNPFDKYNLDD